MMDCKKALDEAKGNIEEAEVILRKKGIAAAAKRQTRSARQGTIGTYIHPGSQLGVMVEVNCETDFVARTDDFQELVKDIAMHIAAADPKYLKRDEVPTAILDKEKRIAASRAATKASPRR
jgi:elongation factor Ts